MSELGHTTLLNIYIFYIIENIKNTIILPVSKNEQIFLKGEGRGIAPSYWIGMLRPLISPPGLVSEWSGSRSRLFYCTAGHKLPLHLINCANIYCLRQFSRYHRIAKTTLGHISKLLLPVHSLYIMFKHQWAILLLANGELLTQTTFCRRTQDQKYLKILSTPRNIIGSGSTIFLIWLLDTR